MLDNDKKEVDTEGEEIICAIIHLENPDKARFANLKKRVENYYVSNEVEYPRPVTAVNSLLLNHQLNYNYTRKSQSQGVRNQLMLAQVGKLWTTKKK